MNETLPIDEVTKEAFTALGQDGVISAANNHTCSECTQPYISSTNAVSENMDIDHADVTMHVLDGIVMGPTHCVYKSCEADLLNACGGAFCPVHEREYGSKCRVVGCQSDKVLPTQACQ